MAGINTIQEAFAKRGESWVRDFFTKDVTVTEKSDAYRFSFELSRTGRLRFFGKNSEEPLNRIDRTVSDLYENAISKIEKLPEAITINLPKNHRFGFSWSISEGLTLTDITIRSKGKVIKEIQEPALIEKWAGLLHVKSEKPGTIDGRIVEQTISSLKGGQPLYEIWDPQKTYILKNGDGVIKIGDTQIKEKSQKSHTFDLLLMQMFEHLQTLNFDKFVFKSPRPDERYLEIVCECFNSFVNERGPEFLEMGIEKPHFLQKSGKFNNKWIRNPKTRELIENRSYEYLLSIFIANLRKPKKAIGLLSESFVSQYNQKIADIDDCVRNPEEAGFPEFTSILEKEEPSLDSDYKQANIGAEDGFSSDQHMKAVGMLQSYFALPFANTNEEDGDDKEPVHTCDVLLINAGEVTKKVINECERLMKLNGRGMMLVHDESAGSHCKWGLEKAEGRALANRLVEEYPHIFECSESMIHSSVGKIVKAAKPREVKNIYVARGGNRLVLEKETLKSLGRDAGVTIAPFKTGESRDIEECMEKADLPKFKKIFPEICVNYWPNMMTNWNSKAYL
jgi:hypothetical protein